MSDTHGKLALADVPPGDVFVHCGDILARNGKHRCMSGRQLLRSFDREVARLPHPAKVVIAGNHDTPIEQLGFDEAQAVLCDATYLENSGTTLVGGLRVWGCPFSPASASSNSAFQLWTEAERHQHFNAIPAGTHVVVSHGTCRGLDAAVARSGARLHVFGHFHEQRGVQHSRGVTLVNASTCDHSYRAVKGSTVIDFLVNPGPSPGSG